MLSHGRHGLYLVVCLTPNIPNSKACEARFSTLCEQSLSYKAEI